MVLIGTFILVFLVLVVWRKFHQTYANLKFKYELYELRDELRWMVHSKKIDCNSWLFDYFDNSLSKAISESYYITFLRLVLLSLKHENDSHLNAFRAKLEKEVNEISELASIRDRYNEAIRSYVLEQHYVSAHFIVIPIIRIVNGTSWAANKLNNWVRGTMVYPETSASNNFSMA